MEEFKDIADFRNEAKSNVFPPVMSYFEPNKFTVSCSNFIDDNRRQFAATIAASEKIAIVGLNVHPVDRHIWEPLSKTNGQVFYLGGSVGGAKYQTWAGSVGRSKDIVDARYFADGYDALRDFLLK